MTASRIPEVPHGEHHALPHHTVNYLAIFLLLVCLTIITVAVALFDIHNELAKVMLALAIATTKASFVALYFMHVKFEGKLVRLILLAPLGFCAILVLAIIPDIAHAHVFNDAVGMFLRAVGKG